MPAVLRVVISSLLEIQQAKSFCLLSIMKILENRLRVIWILGVCFHISLCDVFVENIGHSKLIATIVSKEPFSFYFWRLLSSFLPQFGKKRVVWWFILEYARHTLMSYNYTVTSWELLFGCCFQLIYYSLKMLHSYWFSFTFVFSHLFITGRTAIGLNISKNFLYNLQTSWIKTC